MIQYTIALENEQLGPASLDEIIAQLAGRPLTGKEQVQAIGRTTHTFGLAEHYPELRPLIPPALPPPSYGDNFIGPRPYTPNRIPRTKRIAAALAIPFFLWGLVDLLTNGEVGATIPETADALLPGLWGISFLSFMTGSLSGALCVICDHYDRRPNEHLYQRWFITSWSVLVLGKLSAEIIESILRNRAG